MASVFEVLELDDDINDYKLSTDEEVTAGMKEGKIKDLPSNDDLTFCLNSIGTDNTKVLLKYLKKILKDYIKLSNEVDNNDEKINMHISNTINSVTVKTHMYNTNEIMNLTYSTLELKMVLDFNLNNRGLKIHKEIKVNGSQDFGGCTPSEVKQLISIIKQFIR